jgi:hypothetical protein
MLLNLDCIVLYVAEHFEFEFLDDVGMHQLGITRSVWISQITAITELCVSHCITMQWLHTVCCS